jgi:hypothetical protein
MNTLRLMYRFQEKNTALLYQMSVIDIHAITKLRNKNRENDPLSLSYCIATYFIPGQD